jgi:hypothetical protein
MYKLTVTYENFNEEKVTKDLYFNLTTDEFVSLYGQHKDVNEWIDELLKGGNTNDLLKMLRELIFKSYGIKSADGERFEKSADILKQFKESAAYEAVMVEMLENPKFGEEFISKVAPKSLTKKVSKEQMEAIMNDTSYPESVRNRAKEIAADLDK